MIKRPIVALLFIVGLVAIVGAQTGGACNRECLIGLTEGYLSAMVAREPAKAPVTANVRFTQNTRPMSLGQGLWETVKGVRGYKLFVTDPASGQVALYTVVDGADRPGLLTLRMKVDGQRISEIESVYVGIGQTGFGSVDNLVTVDPVWTAVLPSAQRRPRAEMVDIANRYFETLEKNIVDHVPFTTNCLRVENGMTTAGRAGPTAGRAGAPGLAGLGCRENVNHPMWNYITQIAPRRHLVVDEERGLVSGMYMFRHGGTEPTYTLPSGEVVKHSEAMLRRQAVIISELFKIEDGRIRRIEAVMAGGLDHDASSGWDSANDRAASGTTVPSKRMSDGKEWMTANLSVNASPSHCYDDAEPNCRRYGRLYTWASAQRVCQSLGSGWRLPTDDEWRQMAKRYGGVSADSADKGKAAFAALVSGGTSGFNAVMGGNRTDGKYERVEAHGFYWTASDNDPRTAPFYNFGQNGQALHRQPGGDKQMAISVRCVKDR